MTNIEHLLDELALVSDGLTEKGKDQEAYAIDRAMEIVQVLQQWSQAYPLDIFPPPDWEQVHRALRQVDVSGSALAADCMRYVVKTMHDRADKIAGQGYE